MARCSLFVLKVPLNTNQPSGTTFSLSNRYSNDVERDRLRDELPLFDRTTVVIVGNASIHEEMVNRSSTAARQLHWMTRGM